MMSAGLINLFENRLATSSLPRTHKLGKNAIDHTWISGGILNSVHSAGYAPFDFIGDPDHRGLYFDIILDRILDTSIVP